MMDYMLLFLPIIGGLIGWLTNWLAIKLIFKPHQPYKIPIVGKTIQGLLPKRKGDLARSVAKTVENDLLPKESLLSRVKEMKLKDKIEQATIKVVQRRLDEKLSYLPSLFREKIKDFLKDILMKELDYNLDGFLVQVQEQIVQESNLGQIVEEQINQFDTERLEKLVLNIVAKELKHIEILGGILGFLIGIVQALIVMYFG